MARDSSSIATESMLIGGLWQQTWKRFIRKKVGLFCLFVIVILYLSGIFASWIAPYGYNVQSLGEEALQGPSLQHLFGTDRLGRDLFSRILFGIQTTVIVSLAAIITGSIAIGIILGLVSGYFGGLVDAIVMRIGEIFLAFPGILLVILIASTVKPRIEEWAYKFEDITGIQGILQSGLVDYVVVFGALAAFSWVGMARLVRGQVLYIKQGQFVEAALAVGASRWRVLWVHILPNVISPIVVVVSMTMGSLVGTEIILSWMGLGIQPPRPSLGTLIFEHLPIGSISVLRTHPYLVLFPIGVVATIIFAFNLLGDALNDALNPRTR